MFKVFEIIFYLNSIFIIYSVVHIFLYYYVVYVLIMSGKKIYDVEKHWSADELDQKIRGLKNDVRVLKKLYFIKSLYRGESVEKSADLICVTKATGYNWLKAWNKHGYEGLLFKPKSGRPSRLSDTDKEELEKILRKKDTWETREVQDLVKKEFSIEYSSWQIRRIMKSLGMKYAKPLPQDYRRPENAEDILKKQP